MNFFKTVMSAAALAALSAGAASAVSFTTSDEVNSSTTFANNFFVPSDGLKGTSPYYRPTSGDWGWTHGAITASFTTASLLISAFDVDADQGEDDKIEVFDGANWVTLGFLAGNNNIWAYTTFTLTGANILAQVAQGLQVRMNIDSDYNGNDNGSWFTTLAKSVITTNGAVAPSPVPGDNTPMVSAVPVPAAGWLLAAGIAGFAAMRRRKRA